MRALWVIFGFTALGLGIVGIVTPLLPTVPFLLLAAFCFSRSSDRLHDWLLAHPIFGQPIVDWRESGAIRRRAKWMVTASMLLVLILAFSLGLQPLFLLVQGLVLCAVAAFIWTRPEA